MQQLPLDGDLVLLQMGGLGDLVLLAETAEALRQARPSQRIVLVCRAAVAPIARLWPEPPDDIVALEFDPAQWEAPSDGLIEAVAAALQAFVSRRAAAVVDVAQQPGWFGPVLAASLKAAGCWSCPGAPGARPQGLKNIVLDSLGFAPAPEEVVVVPPRLPERSRQNALLAALGVAPAQRHPWRVPASDLQAGAAWLERAGLPQGRYVACHPGSAASTAFKRWSRANFTALLRDLQLPVLLLGGADDEAALQSIARSLEGLPCAVLAGAAQELPLAAALLSFARVWVANDSGPMHLGQALAVPGVALFGGGGRWPAYTPWAPGALGVVGPLPCFGCDWDCVLGHALCVERIPVESVLAALHRCMAAPDATPEIIEIGGPDPALADVIADAADSYRAAQRDRSARLEMALAERRDASRLKRDIERLQDEIGIRDREIVVLRQAAGERLVALEAVHQEAAKRAALIESLHNTLAARGQNAGPDAAATPTQTSQPLETRAWQISVGLGAGNIGDELMNDAFWSALPHGLILDVPLFPESARQRRPYPRQHRYCEVDWNGNEGRHAATPGLLVGGTPVTEAEGLDWPLRFLAPRLEHFHARNLPVDALGVGVEALTSPEARDIFSRAFAPIRSWTVRSAQGRDALLALGVQPHRVMIGADWAWLHRPARDCSDWASRTWQSSGIDLERPLLVANVVNMFWRDAGVRSTIAADLDRAASHHGLQLAFLCNECRDGDFFDIEAARALVAQIASPAVILPNDYYAPDEVIALLGHATVTVGQRYHFVIESVLAGTVPISIPRGEKQRELAQDLGIPDVGSVGAIGAGELLAAIDDVLSHRDTYLNRLAQRQRSLAMRASRNLDLIRDVPYYARSFAQGRS